MPSEVHTICFHTRDAVERDDSRMVFEMPQHRFRTNASRVSIGSVEFPMVQYSIEEEWRSLYLSEGLWMDGEEESTRGIAVVATSPHSEDLRSEAFLPGRFNPLRSIRVGEGGVRVQTVRRHHLWNADSTACLIPHLVKCGCCVKIISTGEEGDVDISHMRVRLVSEDEFDVLGKDARILPKGGIVYVSCVPTVADVCELLTRSCSSTNPLRFHMKHDAETDRVALKVVAAPANMRICVEKGVLASLLGLCTVPQPVTSDDDATLPSDPTAVWDRVDLPLGFYGPCHRPMCTGAPRKFGAEVEAALNRWHFPLPSQQDPRMGTVSSTSPHGIVFTDPLLRTVVCPIPCGRYSAEGLCSLLQAGMTQRCSSTNVRILVRHQDDRFTFACERREEEASPFRPCCFSILFHHPLSTEASRFGFASQPLVNASSYTAPEKTHEPTCEGRPFTTAIRVLEDSALKRFDFDTAPASTLNGIVQADGSIHLLVNRLPFSHAWREGDVVRVAPSSEDTLQISQEDTVPAARWDNGFKREFTCVVLSCEKTTQVQLFQPPPLPSGTFVTITRPALPWNLSFCRHLPNGIDAEQVGFPARCIQWGHDGNVVADGGLRVPPYAAPNVHSLDHPDYVLITLNESNGASLEHTFNGESKHVMCKLSLYPLFREERMLPRDSTLGRSTFSRFEIAFWNPDMRRPYHFHGAQFSFSLNFVSAVPDA